MSNSENRNSGEIIFSQLLGGFAFGVIITGFLFSMTIDNTKLTTNTRLQPESYTINPNTTDTLFHYNLLKSKQ